MQMQNTTTLVGHMSWVGSVAYSPDGAALATGSADSTVRLWDAATGKCKAVLRGHDGYILALAYAPDGHTLVSSGDDRSVRFWDAATGTCVAKAEGHRGCINAIAYAPDARLVATAADDNAAKLWDPVTHECVATLAGHDDYVLSVAFAPDGRTLATGGADNTVRLWDADTFECVGVIDAAHSSWVHTLTFSPRGVGVLATGGRDGTVKLWDVASRQCMATFTGHSQRVQCVRFDGDGATLVSAGVDKAIRVWDVARGECVAEYTRAHGMWMIPAVACSPGGRGFASASWDRTVKIWGIPDVANAAPRGPLAATTILVRGTDPVDATTVASSEDAVEVTPAEAEEVDSTPSFRRPRVSCVSASGGGHPPCEAVVLRDHADTTHRPRANILEEACGKTGKVTLAQQRNMPHPPLLRPASGVRKAQWPQDPPASGSSNATAMARTPQRSLPALSEVRPAPVRERPSSASTVGTHSVCGTPYALKPLQLRGALLGDVVSVKAGGEDIRPLSAPALICATPVPETPQTPPPVCVRGQSWTHPTPLVRGSPGATSHSDGMSSCGDGDGEGSSDGAASVMSGTAAYATRTSRGEHAQGRRSVASTPNSGTGVGPIPLLDVESAAYENLTMDDRRRRESAARALAVAVSNPVARNLDCGDGYLYASPTEEVTGGGVSPDWAGPTRPRLPSVPAGTLDRKNRELLSRRSNAHRGILKRVAGECDAGSASASSSSSPPAPFPTLVGSHRRLRNHDASSAGDDDEFLYRTLSPELW